MEYEHRHAWFGGLGAASFIIPTVVMYLMSAQPIWVIAVAGALQMMLMTAAFWMLLRPSRREPRLNALLGELRFALMAIFMPIISLGALGLTYGINPQPKTEEQTLLISLAVTAGLIGLGRWLYAGVRKLTKRGQ